ncbi:MAG: hypothetical protein WCE54_15885 [Ignavibacteriaceae bacterium]
MKIITSYFNGFILANRAKKLVTTIFLITLLLALILAVPFGSTIENEAGSSMAFVSLLKDFNYTVYKDFMNQYAGSINPFISIAVWTGIFYILFTIFFEGGVLDILIRNERKYSLTNFWGASARYFSRFLRLAIYSIIFQVVIALAVYIPVVNILDLVSAAAESEKTLFYVLITGFIIHLVFFIFILTVTDYAKIMMVQNIKFKPFKTLFKSFRFVLKHFLSTYFLYLILLIVPVVFFILYFWLEAQVGMSTGIKIFIIFVIQQLFIWCRVFIKIWMLGSELFLYGKFVIKEKSAVKEVVFEI